MVDKVFINTLVLLTAIFIPEVLIQFTSAGTPSMDFFMILEMLNPIIPLCMRGPHIWWIDYRYVVKLWLFLNVLLFVALPIYIYHVFASFLYSVLFFIWNVCSLIAGNTWEHQHIYLHIPILISLLSNFEFTLNYFAICEHSFLTTVWCILMILIGDILIFVRILLRLLALHTILFLLLWFFYILRTCLTLRKLHFSPEKPTFKDIRYITQRSWFFAWFYTGDWTRPLRKKIYYTSTGNLVTILNEIALKLSVFFTSSNMYGFKVLYTEISYFFLRFVAKIDRFFIKRSGYSEINLIAFIFSVTVLFFEVLCGIKVLPIFIMLGNALLNKTYKSLKITRLFALSTMITNVIMKNTVSTKIKWFSVSGRMVESPFYKINFNGLNNISVNMLWNYFYNKVDLYEDIEYATILRPQINNDSWNSLIAATILKTSERTNLNLYDTKLLINRALYIKKQDTLATITFTKNFKYLNLPYDTSYDDRFIYDLNKDIYVYVWIYLPYFSYRIHAVNGSNLLNMFTYSDNELYVCKFSVRFAEFIDTLNLRYLKRFITTVLAVLLNLWKRQQRRSGVFFSVFNNKAKSSIRYLRAFIGFTATTPAILSKITVELFGDLNTLFNTIGSSNNNGFIKLILFTLCILFTTIVTVLLILL